MAVVDNDLILEEVSQGLYGIEELRKIPLIIEPFENDFIYRLCWSSNAIEGNTLSLDETVSVIEYDEVQTGHSFTEYEEAKLLYGAIKKLLSFESCQLTETWIIQANKMITNSAGEYRSKNVYVGTQVEATFYPPDFNQVAVKMGEFMQTMNFESNGIRETVLEIARQHMMLERIHPFDGGNGRTGRLLLNQQLINHGLLPVAIEDQSKYRQAFRIYDRNQDLSLLVHLICKGELASIERIHLLNDKLKQSNKKRL